MTTICIVLTIWKTWEEDLLIAPFRMSLELLHLSLLNSSLYPHLPPSSAILFTGMLVVILPNFYKLITFLCITLL